MTKQILLEKLVGGCPFTPCGLNEYCSNVNSSYSCNCYFGLYRDGSSCTTGSVLLSFNSLHDITELTIEMMSL